MQIKIITSNSPQSLEKPVNEALSELGRLNKIVNVKFAICERNQTYIAYILYEPRNK